MNEKARYTVEYVHGAGVYAVFDNKAREFLHEAYELAIIANESEQTTKLEAKIERLRATCETLADALECFLIEYEDWPDGEKTCVDMMRATIAQYRAHHDST